MNAAAIGQRPRPALVAQGLLVLLAAGGLSWSFTQVAPRHWQPPPEAAVVLAGEHYRVAPDELRSLQELSALHFGAGEESARTLVASQIDAHLDRMFAHALERLPEFADWYYSLRGEYSRAAMAALSFANVVEPGYVANQAAAMLLPENAWAASFEQLETDTAASLRAHQAMVREGWLDTITRRLSAHRVPAPLAVASTHAPRTLVLDSFVQDLVARDRAALNTRLSLSTVAAGGAVAAGPALWRAAAARGSAAAGRAAAARAAVRGASRAGPAAVGGAALCSPTGPVAVGCALFAGAAVWLATDWALLKVDEQLHRDDLVAALESGLAALREQIEHDLQRAYDEMVAGHYGAVAEEIRRSFIPAHASEGEALPR
jgi:hypothetical protein